jgi:hypothetical protein
MHRVRVAVAVISASFLLMLEQSSASAQSAQAHMNCLAAFDSTITERSGPGEGSSNAPHDNSIGNATKRLHEVTRSASKLITPPSSPHRPQVPGQ